MAFSYRPQCGRPVTGDAKLCPTCAAASASTPVTAQASTKPAAMRLDCQACKETGSMAKTQAARFHGVVRVIGFLIAAPSVIGVIFAVILFFTGASTGAETMAAAATDAERAGAAMGTGLVATFSIGLGVASLIGGLIGYLLLSRKKVWRCDRCGFVLERA